ncbi:MAG: hypothetical protein ACXACB_08395 [Promethearchaeota archaeon]
MCVRSTLSCDSGFAFIEIHMFIRLDLSSSGIPNHIHRTSYIGP